jgi:hypothetical protein
MVLVCSQSTNPKNNSAAREEGQCESNELQKGWNCKQTAWVSASGQYIPPFIIMEVQWYNENYEIGMPPGTKVILLESGYMKWEHFSKFLYHSPGVKSSGSVI